ncbi:MAG: hypothetical protein H8D47_00110 [Planctomycetes bacterium]|nr:hypothetical protein [Planctomycetota bacterium]
MDSSISKRVFRLSGVLSAFFLLFLHGGCGDFFEKQTTEIETRRTLDELAQIRENQNIDNPLPELYREEPKRIKVNGGVKLFYFTKNHTVDKLANLVKAQMGVTVTPNPATNQLIMQCKDDSQVDEVLEFLRTVDVEPIQVNIDCLVLERFADVTTDWQTKIRIENILGEGIWASGKGDDVDLAFPGAALREDVRDTFGLDIGILRGKSGHQIKAVVDMLVSRGYLKILMNPSIETINGQKAKVISREEARHDKIVSSEINAAYSITEYVWVEDSLEVTPYVFSDGSIGLETSIKLGSSSKPEGVAQASVITERSVDIKENRIAPGDSLVIGGIRKSTKRSVIRGVPFFKDLPLIGIFFSSKDFEEHATEVIFILTPTISSGGVKYADMVEDIQKKHSTPKYEKGLEQIFTDPFGSAYYTESMEAETAEVRFEKFKTELEKAEALVEVREMKDKLLESAEQFAEEQKRTKKAIHEANAAQVKAEQAQQEAVEAKKLAEKEKEEVLKIKAELETKEKKAKAELLNEVKEAAAESGQKSKQDTPGEEEKQGAN